MDSLLANYASDGDDDEGVDDEKVSDGDAPAAKSLQLPPPKLSSSPFSSSLPPPKSSAALKPSSSLFSSLPAPKSISSTPSSASQKPSRPKSVHLDVVDGEEEVEEEGGFFTAGTPSSTPFRAQSSIFSALPPPKPSSYSRRKASHVGAENGEEEEKGGIFTADMPSSTPVMAQKSMFSALPPPKDSSSTSLFSSIPPPKSEQPNPQKSTNPPSSARNPKRVVQFKLPLNPSMLKSRDFDDDDDDDEEDKERRSVKDSFPVATKASSSVSSMLPAPKNTFGLARSAASASSRRSIVEADVPAGEQGGTSSVQESFGFEDSGSYHGGLVGAPPETVTDGPGDLGFPGSTNDVGWDPSGVEGTIYPGFADSSAAAYWDPSYGGAVNYESYEGNWSEGTAAVVSEAPGMTRIAGKRGRNDIPTEIVEVKQDELMKNRPRQDQTKLTGIAFGPSYQV
ncbi:hypothetical protein B296_00024757 [Ensete ventricosum]|uniref:Uncharacterized protein n=1 Tax=Ensete ventricosum TaxID=4639 RepID=A0A426ZPC4_ENSVE|nr:hypothetical protein B296_00024757 [Ensete ventricosum]